MKKFIISLLMVLAAIICLKAGTLGEVFGTIRPLASFVQDASPAQLASENLKAASVAVLNAESLQKAIAAVPADLKPVEESNENGNMAKVYMVESGDESELLVLAHGNGQHVALYFQGPVDALEKSLQQ